MAKKSQRILSRGGALLSALLIALLTVFSPAAFAQDAGTQESGRWGAAADEIDKYLDAGFEYYLEGDTWVWDEWCFAETTTAIDFSGVEELII